jgi:hypothetical protein
VKAAVTKIVDLFEFQKKPETPIVTTGPAPKTIPAPPMPKQKWLLIVDDGVLKEFDRQNVKYYRHDVYLGAPTVAEGVNVARGTKVSVKLIANYPPVSWEERPITPGGPAPLTGQKKVGAAAPAATQPATTSAASSPS